MWSAPDEVDRDGDGVRVLDEDEEDEPDGLLNRGSGGGEGAA